MEYKFRGKAIANDEWYYGDLIIVNDTDKSRHYYIIADEYSDEDGNIPNTIKLDTCNSPEVNKETVGQYTGLKDKNGKEIYEGDIVLTQPYYDKPYSTKRKSKRHIGIVEYSIKCGNRFVGDEKKIKYWGAEWIVNIKDYGKYTNYGWGEFFECEIIGNIYDNPKLLKEE